MIHKYLFFIDGEEIQSYKFDKDKIELIKYKGELACSLNDQWFWSWWEKSSSYISSEDLIDFCFIGTINSDFFKLSYKTVEVSEWRVEKIEMVFNEHIKYSSLKLRCLDTEDKKYLQLVKNPTTCNYQKTAEFNIFTVPSMDLLNKTECYSNVLGLHDLNEKSIDITTNSLRAYYLECLHVKSK
jgi:hypothetical protein